MSAYTDEIDTHSPLAYYRLGEPAGSSTLEDFTTNNRDLTVVGAPVFEKTGAINNDSDTAIEFRLSEDDRARTFTATWLGSLSNLTVLAWVKFPTANPNGFAKFFRWIKGSSQEGLRMDFSDSTTIRFVVDSSNSYTATVSAMTNYTFVAFTFAAGTGTFYINGSAVTTSQPGSPPSSTPVAGSTQLCVGNSTTGGEGIGGDLDDVTFIGSALSAQDVLDLWNLGNSPPPPEAQSIPVTLQGYLSTIAQSVPVTCRGMALTGSQSIPVLLQAADPTHYRGATATWGLTVELDHVDLTSKLINSVTIEAEEDTSSLCSFELIPAAGSVDPADYERKKVTVDFLGKNSSGTTLYTIRRYTGITTQAVYDPDSGVMSVEATTDLQGQIENMSREAIENIVGGTWSKHVFDESADFWQYAQDRLATRPAEMHVSVTGAVITTDWAAKTTADIEFTDSLRFNDTLRVTRATRRDMISRVSVNFDFRFTRLRHREMVVSWQFQPGLCGYLDGDGNLPQRSAILSAANSSGWTRITDVFWTELPREAQANICGGKNFVGDTDGILALGASWTAARRWAQTVTEVYTTEVKSPDIEEAIGQQAIFEDYGIESTYDAGDYENIRDFDSAPAGSTISSATDDYQLDADDAEEDGRDALNAAQEVAFAKAEVEILSRARRNRVTVSTVYDPTLTLESTVRINTPSLTCKGKVYAYTETLNVESGEPSMDLEIALSRHGGSGLGAGDTLDAPTKPEQTNETPTSRSYYLPTHLGGTINAPADNPDWDGWVGNAYGAAQTDPTKVYRERFALRMPEIEEAARNATEIQKTTAYEIVVPEDELTMSY